MPATKEGLPTSELLPGVVWVWPMGGQWKVTSSRLLNSPASCRITSLASPPSSSCGENGELVPALRHQTSEVKSLWASVTRVVASHCLSLAASAAQVLMRVDRVVSYGLVVASDILLPHSISGSRGSLPPTLLTHPRNKLFLISDWSVFIRLRQVVAVADGSPGDSPPCKWGNTGPMVLRVNGGIQAPWSSVSMAEYRALVVVWGGDTTWRPPPRKRISSLNSETARRPVSGR